VASITDSLLNPLFTDGQIIGGHPHFLFVYFGAPLPLTLDTASPGAPDDLDTEGLDDVFIGSPGVTVPLATKPAGAATVEANFYLFHTAAHGVNFSDADGNFSEDVAEITAGELWLHTMLVPNWVDDATGLTAGVDPPGLESAVTLGSFSSISPLTVDGFNTAYLDVTPGFGVPGSVNDFFDTSAQITGDTNGLNPFADFRVRAGVGANLDPLTDDKYNVRGSAIVFGRTIIPEPGTWMLFGFGVLGLGLAVRMRKRNIKDATR
jgi:hypothetical protein